MILFYEIFRFLFFVYIVFNEVCIKIFFIILWLCVRLVRLTFYVSALSQLTIVKYMTCILVVLIYSSFTSCTGPLFVYYKEISNYFWYYYFVTNRSCMPFSWRCERHHLCLDKAFLSFFTFTIKFREIFFEPVFFV